jgi:hypothetical protein
MGFFDFVKKLFSSDAELEDAELSAARARHGIVVNEAADEKEAKKAEAEAYDPWEEVRNARMNFLVGSWATKKFHIVGEEKVKEELAALDRKREGAPKASIEAKLEALDKKEEGKKGK